jgi:tetratricopeptide (TPR) repeat protein
MDKAISSYLKAAEIKPLASAFYNLSQISRLMLDYTKGNEYFNRALEIDRNAVSDYRSIYSRNPNRMVVDETLSYADIWKRAMEMPVKASTFGTSVLPAFFLRLCLMTPVCSLTAVSGTGHADASVAVPFLTQVRETSCMGTDVIRNVMRP